MVVKKAVRKLIRRAPAAGARAQVAWGRVWTKTRNTLLSVAGFGAIDYGVFVMWGNWGWLATGASVLVLEALLDSDDKDDESEPEPALEPEGGEPE